MNENDDISKLKGIGSKRAELLRGMGINSVGDLLSAFPRDYTDYSDPVPIKDLEPEENAVFAGRITKKLRPYITPRVSIFRAVADDGTDTVLITIFNSQYSFDCLTEGQEYIFSGKIKGSMLAKECQSPGFVKKNAGGLLVPKYRLTQGLSIGVFTKFVQTALASCLIEEYLPSYIRERYGLIPRRQAFECVHFPDDRTSLERGRRTLGFTELLTLRLGMLMLRSRKREVSAAFMSKTDMNEFYSGLSFTPTEAQKRSIRECIGDMTSGRAMNRLLQGDVGSGKTLVAAALCFFAAKNGYQSALMAPTEILAVQHFGTLSSMLVPYGINVVLLTGSSVKKPVYEALSSGEALVAVGTHALIQSAVEFCSLGLVITDEQHRFGVRQRTELSSKGKDVHTLVMSATPIPRTLALSVYGDLDVSVLDQMPKGRIPIKTYGVTSAYRERIYKFIIKNINSGYQAYIVCPLVGKSDASDKASALEYYGELKKTWFSDIPVGLLHGKMKQSEKDSVMSDFKSGKIKLLVATTVIEVGIDVPNAIIMVIENAEQFGLSQLHQLRGRVGRGSVQSHCILITDSDTDYTKARVDTMVRTTDGFEIAEEDLRLRGPGSFFGARQHGLPELKIADISSDIMLIQETGRLADEISADDPELLKSEHSGLKQLVVRLFRDSEAFGTN